MGQIIPIKDHDKPCPAHRPQAPEAYYTKQEIDGKLVTKLDSGLFSKHDTNEYRHVPTDGETEGKILTVNAEGKPEWSEELWGYAKWGMIGGDINDQTDLQQEFTDEATAREQADTQLQTNINTEASTRATADTTLQNNITAETTRATGVEGQLRTDLTAETNRAEGEEATLQTNIDNEATTRAQADTALGTRITEETTRATEAEGTLTTNLTAEVNRATAQENVIAGNLSSEVTRATGAETTLQTNIDNEATTRGNADTQLQTNIDTEKTRAQNVEASLSNTKENLSNKVNVIQSGYGANEYPTAQAVYAAIQAIPTGMIYQGTLAHTETIEATVHELPTAEEAHEGWTYKVIEAYEYITGETAEKGDLYVCGWNTETEIHQWKIIPAFEKVKDVQVDGASVVDSSGFAHITYKFFWCTYGTTTYEAITNALAAGKVPVCIYHAPSYSSDESNAYENQFYVYFGMRSDNRYYFNSSFSDNGYYLSVDTTNTWRNSVTTLEYTAEKVSTITGYESDTSRYPNTKAVADYWDVQNKFYWCTFSRTGEGTTYDEVTAAIAAGKTPVCLYPGASEEGNAYSNALFTYMGLLSSGYYFTALTHISDSLIYASQLKLSSNNIWQLGESSIQCASHKKQTIVGNESSQSYYPSTKAVADYWTAQNKFYWCTYGTTTSQEISDAISNGKTPVVVYTGSMVDEEGNETDRFTNALFIYQQYGNNVHYFGAGFFSGDGLIAVIQCNASDTWSAAYGGMQNSGARVNTIEGYETSTTNYPSTKAIADYNKFYWCTYGTTTYQEISDALTAGKVPVVVYPSSSEDEEDYYPNMLLTYVQNSSNTHTFAGTAEININCRVQVTSANVWSKGVSSLETLYSLRGYVKATIGSLAIPPYSLCARDKAGLIVPIAQNSGSGAVHIAGTLPFNPNKIYFMNRNGCNPSTEYNISDMYTCRYCSPSTNTFNTTVPINKDVYLVGTYDRTTDLFTLDTTSTVGETCYYLYVPNNDSSIVLSDYFTAGKYYIKLGESGAGADYFQLEINNPMYYFDGTSLIDPHDNKFYWCTYSTSGAGTTYDEITAAIAAGKTPLVIYPGNSEEGEDYFPNCLCTYVRCVSGVHYFQSFYSTMGILLRCTQTTNYWSYSTQSFTPAYSFTNIGTHTVGSLGLPNYRLCAFDEKGLVVPISTVDGTSGHVAGSIPFRPEDIRINTGSAVASGSTVSDSLASARYCIWIRYNFNTQWLVTDGPKTIYLVGSYDRTTGLFTLDTTGTAGETCYYLYVPNNNSSLVLSDYFTAGKYYIEIGRTHNSNNYFQFELDNPLYYFDGTNLIDPHDNKFYWCTYGTTTYAEITNAIASGKTPVCIYSGNMEDESGNENYFSNMLLAFAQTNGTTHYFTALGDINFGCRVTVSSSNVWARAASTVETLYNLRTYSRYKTSSKILPGYTIIARDEKGLLVPMVNEVTSSFTKTASTLPFRPEKVYFLNQGSIAANTSVDASGIYQSNYIGSCQNTFNSTVPPATTVYLAGTYDRTTGLFTLDTTGTAGETCYYVLLPNNDSTISLSDYFTTGKYYIQVGRSSASNNTLQLEINNPLYYFDGTNLVPGNQSFITMTQAEFEALSTHSGMYFVY